MGGRPVVSEATQLLTSLERQGVVFYAEGSHLRYRAPKGVLTEKLRGQLMESKDALLAVWRERAANSVASHPGTYGQKALWFLHRALPESAAYNVVFTARIRSAVDLPALRCACQALVDRHAALRTTFAIEEGQLVQRVHGYVPMHVQVFDRPDKDVEALREEVIGAARAPFDLQSGPLMRVQLFTRSPNDHVILIALHHIAADGWSLFLLLDDLRWLYPLGRNGAGPAPPRPAHDVLAYCRWQKEMLAGRDGQEHESYWLKELAGEIPPLSLPTDRSRSSSLTDHGETLAIDLGAELSSAVRSLAAAEGTTTFVVLLAAYQILLHRWTGQPEVIVGSPTYGRDRPEFANVVGDFINMIPLKGKVHDDPPFREFLAQLRRATIEGIKHQDYPFPLLVEKLNPQRELARSPIFQTIFILQRFKQLEGLQRLFSDSSSTDHLDFGGLALEPFPVPQQEGQFELSLELTEKEGAFQGSLKYSTDLYGRETIERLGRHYVRLLQGIVAAPETRVSRLPLLEVEEQERIVVEWNQTRVNYGEIACLHELFQAQVDRSPESVAVVFEGRTLTYRELEVRANQVAHFLRRLGVVADSLVGICVERSLEMVIGLLGILKAGGAYVPLDPSYPEDRLAFMLEDAGVSVLLSQNHVLGRLPSHRAKAIRLDADWDRIVRESRDRLSACARPDNLAYMIYTSGSTGRPKGAMITHRGIFNRLLWMQEQYRLSQNDAVLQKTPFSFDVSVWEFFWPLLAGARLVVARPGGHQDPAYLIDVIAREHITITHFVPSMLRVFLEADGLERCGTLREVICSGEALAPDLVKRFYSRLGANLHNLYGPTEAAVDVTYWSCPRGSELSVVPIGRPLANTQCYILDAQMQPVPVGVPGELHLGGVQVGRGYYRRPELTAEKFIADPFSSQPGARLYKTGDLCRYLPDGCIEYLGRIDHQVKLRGFRIELGEVEACLAKHPSVKDVVVVVRNDPSNEQRLAAYIVGSDGSPADPEGLREYLRALLPEYMVPSVFVVLDKLPLSPSGKIDRKALPILSAGDVSNSAGYVPPRTEVEKIMAEIWAEVLGVKKVSVYDNFFELGGHSLLATRLIARLRSAFQIDLPLRSIFAAPTIAGISNNILYDAPTRTYRFVSEIQRWKRLVPAQPKGSRTPLFLVAGYMDADDTLRVLSRIFPYLGPDQPVFGFQPRWLDGQSRGYSCVEEMALECLIELRSAQPKGPYLLGGDCVEGVVALEIARELLRQGEEVRLLVMFDTLRPTTLRTFLVNLVSTWDRIKHIGDVIGQVIKGKNGSRKQLIKDLVRRKFASAQTKTSAESASDRAYRSRIDYRRMIHRHRVKEYAGRITLIVNEKQYRIDKNLGWKGIALGGLEIFSTPGDHMSRYNVDHKEFAERLRGCLERAQG
jgi:amino acid adenylation domain-containing protein